LPIPRLPGFQGLIRNNGGRDDPIQPPFPEKIHFHGRVGIEHFALLQKPLILTLPKGEGL